MAKDEKIGPRVSVTVSAEAKAKIDEWAIERDIQPGAAADLLVGIGDSRLKATTAYAAATRKPPKPKKVKAPKAAKPPKAPKAPKAPKPKKAPKAKKAAAKKPAKAGGKKSKKAAPELPAAEASPTLLGAPVGVDPFDDDDFEEPGPKRTVVVGDDDFGA